MSILDPVNSFLGKLDSGRPVISVDIDNTLSFFTPHLLAIINSQFGTDYKLKDQKEPGLHFLQGDELQYALLQHSSPIFFRTMSPDYAAIAAVQAIKDAGYYVIIASSRVPEVQEATIKWLDKWQVPYDEVRVGHHVKEQVLSEYPNVLFVDDNPHIVHHLSGPQVQIRLLRRSYTGDIMDVGNNKIVDTWQQILSELQLETPTKIQQLTEPAQGWL